MNLTPKAILNVIKNTTHTRCLPEDTGYDFLSQEVVYTVEHPMDEESPCAPHGAPRSAPPAIATIKLFHSKDLQYYYGHTNNESVYRCEMVVDGKRYSGCFEYSCKYGIESFAYKSKEVVEGFEKLLAKLPFGSGYRDVIFDYPTFKWLITVNDGIHPKI